MEEISMTKSTTPVMSYAELTLPLPEAKELWLAKTSKEWKSQFLLRSAGQSKRTPSLGDLIHDITLLSANHQRLDTQYVISIYLHGYWSLISEWRRLCVVHRSNTFSDSSQDGPNLLLNLRHQELCKNLRKFQNDWYAVHSPKEALLLNLDFMNLYSSLNDLQVFTGKEGEEQARQIYPTLQSWAESTDGRQSVWHAGQILRQAKAFPPGHLREFYAIAVYQATLTIWSYSVVTRTTRNQPVMNTGSREEILYLDDIESAGVQQFISYGQGRPAIRGPLPKGNHQRYVEASLDDPRSCMSISVDIIRANCSSGKDILAPVVENLCQLINQLGNAAWAIGLG
ncbi:hypothetical protein SLS62_002787 [Diatrype stigma]|uniref:Uncharacterized protein n=1 Tax=Diatrype stigma TaxID=117547 RepID=A0AAN9YUP6_9PEZI